MSKIYHLMHTPGPLEEACVWLAKLDRGLNVAEEEDLRQWLSRSQKHVAALMDAAERWDRMDVLSRLADLFPEPRRGARMLASMRAMAVAASVLAVGLAGYLWFLTKESVHTPSVDASSLVSQQYHSGFFETAVGELSTINLTDGSQLTLNTHTKVEVAFTDQERRIELIEGEVSVKVAHDQARPFDVYAGDKIVRAVGTAFNLEMTPDRSVELIVTEGKVSVAKARRQKVSNASKFALPLDANFSILVAAGEQATLGATNEEISPIKVQEIERRLSWKSGNLIFRGEPLKEAVLEINRYTPIKVVIVDESLENVRIAGLYKAGDLEGLLASLQANFNIAHRYVSPGEVILTSN